MSAPFPEIFKALVFEVLILYLKEISLLEAIYFLILEADVLGHYFVFDRMFVLIAKHALFAILFGFSALVANAG